MSVDRDALIEEAAGAVRPTRPDGAIGPHPAWQDLDASGREQVYATALVSRAVEAAAQEDGFSSTVLAVLARIEGADR